MNRNVIAILIFAFILRLISIDQSFWLDEATSGLVVSDLSYIEILTKFSPADFHPPLYYLSLKTWSMFFGTNEIALRLLSVILGTGTVYIAYKIAQNVVKERYAQLAGFLMATSPLHVYYSQEARMYSMAAFFASLSAYFFLLLSKKEEVRYALLTGLTLGLSVLSDYVAVFMIPVIFLAGLLTKKLKNKMYFLYICLPLVVCVLIVTPFFLQQFANALGVKESGSLWWNILGEFSFKNILLVPVKLVIGRISFDNNFIYASYAGVSLVLYGVIVIKAGTKNRMLYFWLLIPAVLSAIFSLFIPILYYFRLLFVLPALYILASIGVSKSNKPANILGVLLLSVNIVSIVIYYFNPRFHRENWRGLVNYISQQTADSEVVFSGNSQMEAFDYYNNHIERTGPGDIDFSKDKIWLMRYVHDIYDPNDELPKKISEAGFTKVHEHDFNSIVVWEYENSN